MIKSRNEAIKSIIDSCEKCARAYHPMRESRQCVKDIEYFLERERREYVLKDIGRIHIRYTTITPEFDVF